MSDTNEHNDIRNDLKEIHQRISELTTIIHTNIALEKERFSTEAYKREQCEKTLDKHDKVLHGNGKPGLVAQVNKLKWTIGIITFCSNAALLIIMRYQIVELMSTLKDLN